MHVIQSLTVIAVINWYGYTKIHGLICLCVTEARYRTTRIDVVGGIQLDIKTLAMG